jgi:hypothetical protein
MQLARTCTTHMERRLLWEVSRLRRIALQAHELDILLNDERMLGADLQLTNVAKALRTMLEVEPVVLEAPERADLKYLRKKGVPV